MRVCVCVCVLTIVLGSVLKQEVLSLAPLSLQELLYTGGQGEGRLPPGPRRPRA